MPNPQLRIICATALAAVIAIVLLLAVIFGPAGWEATLIEVGTAVVAWATGLFAIWKKLPDRDHDGNPDLTDPAPDDPSIGVALLFVAATLTAASSGCSPSQLAIQADAAAVAGRSVAAADTTIIRTRGGELDALVAAAEEECGSAGCSEVRQAELVAAYDARVEHWAPVLACRAPVVEGLRSWIDAIELANTAASEDLALEHVVAEAARAVLLWRAFRSCIVAAAPEIDLPELPTWIHAYAESAAR